MELLHLLALSCWEQPAPLVESVYCKSLFTIFSPENTHPDRPRYHLPHDEFPSSPVSFINRYQPESEEFAHCVCCSAGKGRGRAANGGRQPRVQDTSPRLGREHVSEQD